MSERNTENSLELITCSEEESQVDIKEKKEIKQKKVNYKEYIKICAKIFVGLVILGVICFLLFAPKKKNLMKNIPLGDSDSSFKEIISKSKTIQTEDQLKLLSSGLSNTEIFKGKKLNEVNMDLLFRASIDGWSQRLFHGKVDNHNNTLVIIKTKKGRIFGGFTTKLWNERGFALDDNNAFGFSFVTMKTYPIINGEYAIYTKNNEPEFVGIFYVNTIIIDQGYTYETGYSYSGITENYEVNGGDHQFEAEEIEVYHITKKN